MKKRNKSKNRIFKRIVSFTLVLALCITGLPTDLINLVSEETAEKAGLRMTVKATTEVPQTQLDKYSANSYTFTSNLTYTVNDNTYSLAEYSQCFQDETWAASHKNDTLILNPANGTFIFDATYNPIGNTADGCAFDGTITLNTTANVFEVQASTTIFECVKDSVTIKRMLQTGEETAVNIPISINRMADAGDTVSALFANHVLGSSSETSYDWKITLDASSAHSYSGVIYEMSDGAKINLTFVDNSSHTPATDTNNNIVSGSIIANNENSTYYGILCGRLVGSSELSATYTNTADTAVTFIGTGAAYCGGLIGEINNATFELLTGSNATKVDFKTAKNQVGFICGHAEDATITLPQGYGFSGTIDGNNYAGGIAGYCKNTIVNYETSSGTIALSNCNIKNGTTTGGVFGYYECNTATNDILLNRTYSLTGCKVEGTGLSGGIAGEYKPTYSDTVTIDLDKYSIDNTAELKTGTSAGGLFGKYTANGSVTITDLVTNTHFAPPKSSVPYGGIIGEYVNTAYANTLTLSNFSVNSLNCTSTGNVGGVIRTLTGSTYVSVSGVSVTNVTANNATYFGGIISTLDNNNAGSFIDVTGNFTLSMASGKTYKGGAIAGSFKKGVIRLAGLTDISGAQAANGYAQLIYENDETLVYAKGSGSDSNWTLKRNASTTASDLGQWGEVVRLFKVGDVYKNAEDARIVSVANNKVTVAQGVTAITDTVSFAKCALNMQLNDGNDHGALCFADKTTYPKSELLKAVLTVSGTIDLSGTGLLGFMRDGGNGCYYNVNNKQDDSRMIGSPDYFTGTITGSNAEIKLAVGESYGSGNTKGGKIYLSHNNGHSAQGLVSFANGAVVSGITVSGSMNVERVDNAGDALHMGAVMGFMTNGAQLTNISVNTQMDFTRSHQNGKIYIGGVAGLFDGDGTGTLSISGSSNSISPEITLHGGQAVYSEENYDNRNNYTGGVIGLLGGKTTSKYDVEIANTDVSPTISLDSNVANTDYSYVGGMIGRIRNNSTNERSVTLNTVTMTGASVDTKSKYAGGLLGSHWERTNLTVDGLTITGSTVDHKYSGTGSKQSGLVFKGTGKWDINSLTIQATSDDTPVKTTFNSTDVAPASFGLIVNEAYSGDDGLYINLKNSGYTLSGVTVSNSYNFFDEIAADTCGGDDIVAGGKKTGIVNINMNAASGTKTKITDVSGTTENGTGTYQNRLYSQLGNLIANQNSRYYYNLDVMMDSNHTKTDGEKFLLWSVSQYAAPNIASNFTGANTGITNIDLSGLSYYPIAGGEIKMPASSTVTFGFNAIETYEAQSLTPDSWSRYPDDTGSPNTATARNQHYLMQTGLFTTVSKFETQTALTLTGDFGYVEGVASGALINSSTSGTVNLTGLTLNGLKPSSKDSYMLINYIDGTGTATPSLTVSNLRATNYNATGVTLPVAKSLFGTATGQNMTMSFSDIKLDARDGTAITDTKWTTGENSAASAMDTAYGTSRSIFSTATIFTELWAAKTCNMEYNYAVEKDWNTATGPREVTYGKEVTDSIEYPNGEKRYFLAGDAYGNFTNPVSNSGTEFDFSAGFLPYVGNYTDKGKNTTYPVTEIKVNYKAPGITEGCGTYNDPYIITTADQLVTVAKTINGDSSGYPSVIRLPNVYNADHVITSWHGEAGDGLYNHSGTGYSRTNATTGITSWNENRVRYYLASAYYKIVGSPVLPRDFTGIGVPNDSSNNFKGNTVFHGVIVGDKTSKPTITIPNGNPLIVVANGAVVKNININVTGNIEREQNETGSSALYGYNGTNTDAQYYGGVIGEIMGGDNIIDDVTVTYSGSTTLSGTYAHIIAEGGMVGCVVNGALIFRGSNTVNDRNVLGGGIYSNQFVGRVINGYAIYEKRASTDTAPNNYNTMTETGEGDNKQVSYTYTYPIDTIDRNNTNKLDVNYSAGTVSVPDAQALYVMSLITQSLASTAYTSDSEIYKEYSPSYGYYNYLTGVARLGDYTDVGCGTDVSQPTDYSSYAYRDSVNNYYSSKQDLVNAPVPYIIYRYTKAYGSDNVTSKNYPARKMTSDNNKFWDITLSSSNTFNTFGDNFKAFRGIGSVGINAYSQKYIASKTAFKIATFDGGNNTIKLHISLPRYRRDQENYFHYQNKSLTQTYSGDNINTQNYGHDQQLWQVMGIGFFDCVLVKNDSDHEYQFQNLKLQGTIEDIVYDSAGNVVTGTCTYNNKNEEQTGQTQLFCVGGVVGKRVTYGGSSDTNNAYDTDCNYSNIRFDGLTITGAYSCGGLVGIDAIKAKRKMEINNCNSTSNGISITGGYYGKDNNLRHGIGSFVGMTFWCRPYIDGGTNKSKIYVSNVTTFYNGTDNRCAVGGLIGYTGSGAEIKNIDLYGLGTNPVVGSSQSSNAAGFIGFSQATNETGPNTTIGDDNYYLNEAVYIENCTLNNTSVRALNSAAGFLARGGNANNKYYPKYIKIINCAVIGSSTNKPEIRTYGTTNSNTAEESRFSAGGFIADFSIHTNTNVVNTPALTSVIENSYIKDYKIEGNNVGGIIGAVNQKPAYLRNLYVQNCDIITTLATANYYGNVGGIVGYSSQNLSGYNLKIDGVNFYRRSGDTLTDVTTTDAGIIVGRNSSSLVDKFVGICAYHTTVAKVPTDVVKTNGTNTGNFFVFTDYTNTSATLTVETGTASTFGNTNNVTQPLAPFVNVAPHMTVGTGEYLTGDGAGIGGTLGNAGTIYKDATASPKSNRAYTVNSAVKTNNNQDQASGKTDSDILANYINSDGTYKNGAFKISTASDVFGDDFPDDIDNFAMLVINNDSDKTADITPFIKSYIRLVTNAAASANQYTFNSFAYSCGNDDINSLYTVNISPCYYDTSNNKFALGTAGQQGLKLYASDTANAGKYYFDSENADSESSNTCQFSLIDVQFKDPTDSSKIAYHLYVPVYTKKMITAEFSAVSMTETKYYRSPYAERIASELNAGKSDTNPSQLVESTDEWITTFIRFTYPNDQISPSDTWNYNKSIKITIDSNFSALPLGTKFVLVDPNANVDKFYTYELSSAWGSGAHTLNLSDFVVSGSNPTAYFTPQNLSAIHADPGASSGNELYEDYYISIYVPKADNRTHNMTIGCGSEMTSTNGNKANIDSKLYSLVVLGDLFTHKITSFNVVSGDGSSFGDSAKMSTANNVLKTDVTATVQIKNRSAGAYLANSNVYHAFFISLTSHDADHNVSDIIYGITPGYISNTTTYSYEGGSEETITNNSKLGSNFIRLYTGDIISSLLLPDSTPVVTIHSVTTMTFNDITAFPYNEADDNTNHIGTQVSIKSNLAYKEEGDELLFSALSERKEDSEGKFYYTTEKNDAELSFNAVPTDDTTDEIGYKTNNRSLLGVNGKYGTSHPIIGRVMYNVDNVVDYESAEQVKYTVELYKKVTDNNGTRYEKVNNISNYMSDVNMTDETNEVALTAYRTDAGKYVYTGNIDHDSGLDSDKMFEATFSCNVLTGDNQHNKYANYKILITGELTNATNSRKDDYLIYTNAKFDPSVIDGE